MKKLLAAFLLLASPAAAQFGGSGNPFGGIRAEQVSGGSFPEGTYEFPAGSTITINGSFEISGSTVDLTTVESDIQILNSEVNLLNLSTAAIQVDVNGKASQADFDVLESDVNASTDSLRTDVDGKVAQAEFDVFEADVNSSTASLTSSTGANAAQLVTVAADTTTIQGNLNTHEGTVDAHFDHADNLAELNTQIGASLADGAHSPDFSAFVASHPVDANAHHTPTVDTNANTICTGTDVFLDGEGNCDTLVTGAGKVDQSEFDSFESDVNASTSATASFHADVDASTNSLRSDVDAKLPLTGGTITGTLQAGSGETASSTFSFVGTMAAQDLPSGTSWYMWSDADPTFNASFPKASMHTQGSKQGRMSLVHESASNFQRGAFQIYKRGVGGAALGSGSRVGDIQFAVSDGVADSISAFLRVETSEAQVNGSNYGNRWKFFGIPTGTASFSEWLRMEDNQITIQPGSQSAPGIKFFGATSNSGLFWDTIGDGLKITQGGLEHTSINSGGANLPDITTNEVNASTATITRVDTSTVTASALFTPPVYSIAQLEAIDTTGFEGSIVSCVDCNIPYSIYFATGGVDGWRNPGGGGAE